MRRIVRIPVALAVGLLAGLLLAMVLPMVVGGQALTVMSGSMAPAVRTGDVVVVTPLRPLRARVGDVITFRDPHDRDRLITHRLRGVEVDGGVARFVTRGDANTAAERFEMPATGTVGRVRYRLPKAGYVVGFAASPAGRVGLVIVPALLLGGWLLARIWRPRPRAVAT